MLGRLVADVGISNLQIMSERTLPGLPHRKDWALTPGAFHRLLTWLDQGVDSDGSSYLEIRRRLVSYFDRKNCPAPDDLADETLNRVARRLEEEGAIESETPAKYCYIVARFVFMESLRESQRGTHVIDEMTRQNVGDHVPETEVVDDRERVLACLDECTSKLEPASRDLITRYYVGKERVKIENRRSLAESLGISLNALSIRACRIRGKLEICVRECANPKE